MSKKAAVKNKTTKTRKSAPRRYPAQFREDAVRLAHAKGASVKDVADRLGISDKSLYTWMNHADEACDKVGGAHEIRDENAKLKTENRRLRMERDILKKSLLVSSSHRNTLRKTSEGL